MEIIFYIGITGVTLSLFGCYLTLIISIFSDKIGFLFSDDKKYHPLIWCLISTLGFAFLCVIGRLFICC